jgi:hypothetical protein
MKKKNHKKITRFWCNQTVSSEMVLLYVVGFLVDSEIVLSTRYGKTRVFINKTFHQQRPLINKTLSTETSYQQG